MPFNPINTQNTSLTPTNTEGTTGQQPTYSYGCDVLTDKDRVEAYWKDLIGRTGVTINYWSHGYTLENQDALYGEDPTAAFRGPRTLTGIVEIASQTFMLGPFGPMTENDVEVYISIDSFKEKWGEVIPNRGDRFTVTLDACDRPEAQDPRVFEVMDKTDNVNPADLFGGHYVWKISATRATDSFEPNAPSENAEDDEGTDTDFVGVLEGGTHPKSPIKTYQDNVDKEAKADYDNSTNSDDNTYGGYL